MRTVTLARIAAEAEGIRLKRLARRQAMRVGYLAVASLFGLFLAVMLHLSVFEYLAPIVGRGATALILAGIDLLIMALFAVLALRDVQSAQEREAELISRQARGELADGLKTLALVVPAARLVGGKGLVGTLLSSLLTYFLTRRRRR